jgi:S-disulfanyl-L-cysteine oxidoreductase SoxD
MRVLSRLMFVAAIASSMAVLAQSPTYRLGRAPTAEEIRTLDTYAGPAGKELVPGKGTAKEGAPLFAQKCAHCHGAEGKEGQYPELVTKNLHPFATTIWSMINSSMPRLIPDIGVRAEKLTADQVYALTAFILFKNGLIKDTDVMDAQTLPRVRIPTRDPRLDSLVSASGAARD